MLNEYYKIIPWEEYYNLVKKHFNITKPRSIDEYFLSGITGEPINTMWYRANEWWESYLEDEKMYSLLENIRPFEGELVIVTEVCRYNNLGAFKVNSSDLKKFVKHHKEVFKFYFFDGDTLIINMEQKLIWMLHHEGVYALIDHSQSGLC